MREALGELGLIEGVLGSRRAQMEAAILRPVMGSPPSWVDDRGWYVQELNLLSREAHVFGIVTLRAFWLAFLPWWHFDLVSVPEDTTVCSITSERDGQLLADLLAGKIVENRARFARVRDAFDGYARWGKPPVLPGAIMMNRIVALVLSGAPGQAQEEIEAWWKPELDTPEMARFIDAAADPARLRELVIAEIRSERAMAGLPPDAFELPAD